MPILESRNSEQAETTSSLKNEEERTVFSWKSPARPFKKRDREFFTTVIAIAVLGGLILGFLEGLLPVLVVVALVFLIYVLSTVPPEEVEHEITNKGFASAGQKNNWPQLRRFWFTTRFSSHLLVFESAAFPGRIEVVVNKDDQDEIKKELIKHIPYQEAAPNFLDKAAAWLSQRVPLDK